MTPDHDPCPSLRIILHALDRTGPAMLARSHARWWRRRHPEGSLCFLAFRGGPLAQDLAELGPVQVVLDDHEPWDPVSSPSSVRGRALADRLQHLPSVTVNLLVSVAAGQVLPLLAPDLGPIVTWSVEVEEDLHWLDEPVDLHERTDRWLAGSLATHHDLVRHLPGVDIGLVDEFIDPPAVQASEVAACRRELDPAGSGYVVLGAGIGTHRKGLDLFAEVAAAHGRTGRQPAAFVWIGGEDGPLVKHVEGDARRFGWDQLTIRESVADLAPWIAAADAFLHPARADAFPLVCVLAAAVGTPVLGFEGRGGLEQMLGDAFRGVPYPDISALADLVAQLGDPEERAVLGRAQQALVVQRNLSPAAAPRLQHELELVGTRR